MHSRIFAVIVLVLPVLWALGAVDVARAAEEDTGLYVSCAANVLVMEGTGEWGGNEFDITAPMSDGSEMAVGLNWDEKLLFGLKPAVGWRFGRKLAVQAGIDGSVPVNSVQTYSTYQGGTTYEQSMDVEWSQQGAEAVAVYFPMSDWDVYFYGGMEWVRIKTEIVLAESAEQMSWDGQYITNTAFMTQRDEAQVLGALVGVGIEFPSENMNLTAFAAMQYSTSETGEDRFFEGDDFRVKVGGVSAQVGLKWFPFDR